jgi:putative addiction module component (TIGR02574 family)
MLDGMAMDVKSLLEEALRLPAEARAALAGELLESLDDDDVDEDVEAAWAKEIERRLKEVDEGKVKTVAWEDVHKELLAIVNKTRET